MLYPLTVRKSGHEQNQERNVNISVVLDAHATNALLHHTRLS